MAERLFSKAAIPSVIGLMDRFNLALGQQIKSYESTKNGDEFGKILNILSNDLQYFSDNFEAWDQKVKTHEEHAQLESLEQRLDQAKFLVGKAARLVDSIH